MSPSLFGTGSSAPALIRLQVNHIILPAKIIVVIVGLVTNVVMAAKSTSLQCNVIILVMIMCSWSFEIERTGENGLRMMLITVPITMALTKDEGRW